MKFNFVCTKEQAAFHALKCKYPAFVGGFGSGKTETMIKQSLIDASAHPKALIALYAPSYDLVRLILAPRLMSLLEYLDVKFTYNKTEQMITTEHPQFGNFIFRSLDTPERIVGYESYRAHIDEIDVLPEHQANMAWNKIAGRNRQRLPGVAKDRQLNRVSAYSTPEGFNFLYKRWKKDPLPEYQMIQAMSESNPMLPDDYISSLRATYPDELISAYLNGEFVNLTTGTVYKAFDRVKHNSKEKILTNDVLYIGIDFNVTNMSATVYVRRLVNKVIQYHAVEEICKLYDTPEMITEIKRRYEGHKIIVYPDASGASRKSVGAGVSDISLLIQAGFEVRAHSKNPLVKDRVNSVNGAFNKGLLFVNVDNCQNVTECLEQQSYNEKGEPDKTKGKDHQNDATGYPIAYEMPIKKPIAHIPVVFASKNGDEF